MKQGIKIFTGSDGKPSLYIKTSSTESGVKYTIDYQQLITLVENNQETELKEIAALASKQGDSLLVLGIEPDNKTVSIKDALQTQTIQGKLQSEAQQNSTSDYRELNAMHYLLSLQNGIIFSGDNGKDLDKNLAILNISNNALKLILSDLETESNINCHAFQKAIGLLNLHFGDIDLQDVAQDKKTAGYLNEITRNISNIVLKCSQRESISKATVLSLMTTFKDSYEVITSLYENSNTTTLEAFSTDIEAVRSNLVFIFMHTYESDLINQSEEQSHTESKQSLSQKLKEFDCFVDENMRQGAQHLLKCKIQEKQEEKKLPDDSNETIVSGEDPSENPAVKELLVTTAPIDGSLSRSSNIESLGFTTENAKDKVRTPSQISLASNNTTEESSDVTTTQKRTKKATISMCIATFLIISGAILLTIDAYRPNLFNNKAPMITSFGMLTLGVVLGTALLLTYCCKPSSLFQEAQDPMVIAEHHKIN